jgi:ssDNA-binding Zn-finger/Zn-ribbon topoisomerase 1
MFTTCENIGECPLCGDELYIFRTKNRKRLVKCINEDCDPPTIYPVPSRGKIECTGYKCPEFNLPILAVVPNLRLRTGQYQSQTKKTYFWTKKPCFTCKNYSKCELVIELQEDY